MDAWYQQLDWEEWTFWHLQYSKMQGECEKIHMAKNLMNGFLTRADSTAKYSFGRHGVFG